MKLSRQVNNIKSDLFDAQNTTLRSNGVYVWKDEEGSFSIKSTSVSNSPSWGEYIPGFQGLIFNGKKLAQVWVDFHINHDYALGTPVYPHIHWMPLDNNSGIVRWGIQYIISKGYSQEAFPTDSTLFTIDHTVEKGSMYKHFITEVPDVRAIISPSLEPDAVIKMRIYRDGQIDTYNGDVHAWRAGLHYQTARIGTVNKNPPFYE